MRRSRRRRTAISCLLVGIVLLVGGGSLSGCSPLYVVRAAYEESKILLAREEISEVLEDPKRDPETKRKLSLVRDARLFAIDMGLTPEESFTLYAKVDKDVLAWVVVGSKPDSFELYTWWFPFVGSVPYKGYFEKDDAIASAERLKAKGYETWVRGTEAISTLGWFNDPVLSTTLRHDDVQIVNTVIHESLHTTLWVKNFVNFNESAANFIGIEGALSFFRARLAACDKQEDACSEEVRKQREHDLASAEASKEQELEVAQAIERIYTALDKLYSSDAPKEEKLAKRHVIYANEVNILRERYPDMTLPDALNNAMIMQLKLYMTDLPAFEQRFNKRSGDWKLFLSDLQSIADAVDDDEKVDPFEKVNSL